MERQGVDQAIARRVRERREQLGWSLERLAGLSGVSRAMISRIERAENSATAALLSKLCFGLGITLSSLMADAERPPHSVVRRTQQRSWRDPETGYGRRMVSPAQTGSAVEIAEVDLPAGAPVPGVRPAHHRSSGPSDVDVRERKTPSVGRRLRAHDARERCNVRELHGPGSALSRRPQNRAAARRRIAR